MYGAATATLAVMSLVAVAGLVSGLSPQMRRHVMVVMPTALGAACFVGAWALLSGAWGVPPPQEGLAARLAWGTDGQPDALRVALSLVGAVLGAGIAFRFERALQVERGRRRRARAVAAGTPSFFGLDLPGRGESMADVAEIAQRPILYAVLSVWAVAGEELFYRGILIHHGALGAQVVVLVLVQAVAYGVTHLAFGPITVVGKTGLGLVLGAASLVGGLGPVLAAHLVYQDWVRGQFLAPRGTRWGVAR